MACPDICSPSTTSNTSVNAFAFFVEVDEAVTFAYFLATNQFTTGLQQIHKYDLSDLSIPTLDSSVTYASGQSVSALKLIGDILYVAIFETSGSDKTFLVKTYDVTTSPPTELDSLVVETASSLPEPFGIVSMSVSEPFLYLQTQINATDDFDRFYTISVTNPSALSVSGFTDFNTLGDTVAHLFLMVADGTTVYGFESAPLGDDQFFRQYDASNPSAVTQVDSITLPPHVNVGSGSFALFYDGALIFLNARDVDSTLYIFDAASFTTLSATIGISSVSFFALPGRLWLSNADTTEIQLYDISDPSSPALCNSITTGVSSIIGAPSLFITVNALFSLQPSSFDIFAIVGCNDTTPVPPGSSQFVACDVIGTSGGYLLIADAGASKLQIYDITDPTNPTSVAELDLDEVPTDILVLDTVVFVAAPPSLYVILIDDINTPTLFATMPTDGEILTQSGNQIYSSGPSAGIKLYEFPIEAGDADWDDELSPFDTGIGKVGFGDNHVYLADLTTNEAELRSFTLGGFECHHIKTGILQTQLVDTELIRARHGLFKGDLVSDTLSVYDYIHIAGRYIIAVEGDPEGVVPAPPGSIGLSDDGSVYVKETGFEDTGWAVMSGGGGGSGITELTGDVTAGPGSGSQAATIASNAVTFAKMQDINTHVLIGRDSALSGDPEEVTISAALDWLP